MMWKLSWGLQYWAWCHFYMKFLFVYLFGKEGEYLWLEVWTSVHFIVVNQIETSSFLSPRGGVTFPVQWLLGLCMDPVLCPVGLKETLMCHFQAEDHSHWPSPPVLPALLHSCLPPWEYHIQNMTLSFCVLEWEDSSGCPELIDSLEQNPSIWYEWEVHINCKSLKLFLIQQHYSKNWRIQRA